jgi:hypothetical protein
MIKVNNRMSSRVLIPDTAKDEKKDFILNKSFIQYAKSAGGLTRKYEPWTLITKEYLPGLKKDKDVIVNLLLNNKTLDYVGYGKIEVRDQQLTSPRPFLEIKSEIDNMNKTKGTRKSVFELEKKYIHSYYKVQMVPMEATDPFNSSTEISKLANLVPKTVYIRPHIELVLDESFTLPYVLFEVYSEDKDADGKFVKLENYRATVSFRLEEPFPRKVAQDISILNSNLATLKKNEKLRRKSNSMKRESLSKDSTSTMSDTTTGDSVISEDALPAMRSPVALKGGRMNACACGCLPSQVLNVVGIKYTKKNKHDVLRNSIVLIPRKVLVDTLKRAGKPTYGSKKDLIERLF